MAIGDRSALEGMPLKLVIISMLIALTVPTVYGALGNFEEVTVTNSLKNEVEELASIVQDLIMMGPGNQRTVTVSVPSDGSFLTIGGASRSDMMSIGYGTKGGEVVRYYLTDPNVLFVTPTIGGLVIEGPGCEMCFRCVEGPSGRSIEVEI
ncbi:MAG: hypothetical protein LLG16_06430 [Euryarchaeota archaeon]|nr:hypothetical protein [Euryarchaeota archaeon]